MFIIDQDLKLLFIECILSIFILIISPFVLLWCCVYWLFEKIGQSIWNIIQKITSVRSG